MEQIPYIIGDIHGCLDELRALEEGIAEHARSHQWKPLLVCVGDLLDRGPRSREVVEHFQQGVLQQTHALVMGNHESELLRLIFSYNPQAFDDAQVAFPRFLFTLEEDFALGRRGSSHFSSFADFRTAFRQLWLNQGGRETMLSYHGREEAAKPGFWVIEPPHLRFMAGLALIWASDDMIVSHALLDGEELAYLSRDAAAFPQAEALGLAAPKAAEVDLQALKEAAFAAMWKRPAPIERLDPHRIHVSGHTPRDYVETSEELGYMQIDTGCVYGKRLTAYCHKTNSFLTAPSRTFWQH